MSGACLLHQALSLGITLHADRISSDVLVSGPSGTESLGLACYRDRARMHAILDGRGRCGCNTSDGTIDQAYRFGRVLNPANGPFSYDEYSRLVELKRTLHDRQYVRTSKEPQS